MSEVEKRVSLKVVIMDYFAPILYNTHQEAYYVYIILCNDGSFDTGLTDDLIKRFEEHANGVYENCYTIKRRA
ncbi:MAG: GIY-YIG nuclease family protein [Ferruginibacter sp.]